MYVGVPRGIPGIFIKVKRLRTENPGPLPTPLPRPEQTLADSSLTLRFLTGLHHCFTICVFSWATDF